MRIGNVRPGINGLSAGLAAGIDVATLVQTDLASRLSGLASNMEQGTAITPEQFRQVLTDDVRSVCINWASQCVDATDLINSAVSQYAAEYNRQKSRVDALVAAGLIYLPGGSQYVPPPPVSSSQVQYSSQPPNALDRVTPQTSTVAPVPGSNVLNPPQVQVPVSGQNAGTFTGADALDKKNQQDCVASGRKWNTTTRSCDPCQPGMQFKPVPPDYTGAAIPGPDGSPYGCFPDDGIPTWALVGAAALGLFLLIGRGK